MGKVSYVVVPTQFCQDMCSPCIGENSKVLSLSSTLGTRSSTSGGIHFEIRRNYEIRRTMSLLCWESTGT